MADNQSTVNSLISGIQFKDTRLASLLKKLSDDLYGLHRQINPPSGQSSDIVQTSGGTVAPSSTLIVTLFTNNIRVEWSLVPGGIFLYELKLGADYFTAVILLTTTTSSADIDPVGRIILTGETYTFWLTTIDNLGNRSSGVISTSVPIPDIGSPVVSSSVISDNVLVSWTAPSSTFTIDHYNLYRNGLFYGSTGGTFNAFAELSNGVYTYGVQAVDIVGNLGGISSITVTLSGISNSIVVSVISSTFSGLKYYVVIDADGTLFCCINDKQTFANHFLDNGWTTAQNQIDAGFPLYFEPALSIGAQVDFDGTLGIVFNSSLGVVFSDDTLSPIIGSYQEVLDFGSIETDVTLSLTFTVIRIINSGIAITCVMEVSDNGTTYSAPTVGTSQFFSSLRYCRVTLIFEPYSIISSANLVGLRAELSTKTEDDGGTIVANFSDVSGTVVTFNKTFRQVRSITLTPLSSSPVSLVYDFSFAPNLTSFKVFAFDSTGSRTTKTISWQARGVV